MRLIHLVIVLCFFAIQEAASADTLRGRITEVNPNGNFVILIPENDTQNLNGAEAVRLSLNNNTKYQGGLASLEDIDIGDTVSANVMRSPKGWTVKSFDGLTSSPLLTKNSSSLIDNSVTSNSTLANDQTIDHTITANQNSAGRSTLGTGASTLSESEPGKTLISAQSSNSGNSATTSNAVLGTHPTSGTSHPSSGESHPRFSGMGN
jgi:hypothetical protein